MGVDVRDWRKLSQKDQILLVTLTNKYLSEGYPFFCELKEKHGNNVASLSQNSIAQEWIKYLDRHEADRVAREKEEQRNKTAQYEAEGRAFMLSLQQQRPSQPLHHTRMQGE